ncbi:hypothetical protein BCR32DRAFT_264920 [Anaeromyces robustus]|uniref:Coth-domain-containing protein n=1 Tax=Anaeromyces robustus TaxID=1754192 RepID=A0A1Y1XLZ6_9FUNG|nr:hypothetical protein BCR32DRAFT_264920 [Anaeromyces robustus]|eukprot:ORX86536.1 hypothetical protein BCR32DRAFT_264920 [Anaeromyces robustus]
MRILPFGITLTYFFALGRSAIQQFNVVSILGEGSSLGVKYNNKVVPLTPSPFPLFTGTVNENSIDTYNYVSLDEAGNIISEEGITRTYSKDISGINEVFNRTNKEITIPDFPKPFKAMFPMGTKKFKPLPDNVIYNIYANCDKDTYEYVSSEPFIVGHSLRRNDTPINCTLTIISPDEVFQSSGTVHIIGYGSRQYKKVSWSLKMDQKFRGRKALKLRAMASDPSLVRESVTSKLYNAMGVPVQEGTYARLFINDDTYGLYHMIDNLNKKWIRNYIHGDNNAKVGFCYKMDSSHPDGPYSDLRYKGDEYTNYGGVGTYSIDEYEESDVDPNDESTRWTSLINFVKSYDNWVNTYGEDNSDMAIEELEKFLNIEETLRFMAIESLILALDNFWLVMSNTALYYNPERNNYQFIPFDFDQVLIGSHGSLIKTEDYAKDCFNWANFNESVFEHYFTNNLMKNQQIKQRYDIILAIASTELFTNNVIGPYIHALASLIEEDVEWNFEAMDNLDISYDGYLHHFTVEDFEDNLSVNQENIASSTDTYNVMDWIEVRGNNCRMSTSNVNVSINKNISDDVEVNTEMDDDTSNSKNSFSIKITLLIIFSQLIYNLLL